MAARQKGTVKWFNVAKGYGFITGADGTDVFVHHAAIKAEGFRSLGEGETVEFEVHTGSKGPEAANVTGPSGGAVKGNTRRRRFNKKENGGSPSAAAAAGGEDGKRGGDRAPLRRKAGERVSKCYNCNGEGHLAKDCSEPRKPKACHTCGEAGHLKADCPKNSA